MTKTRRELLAGISLAGAGALLVGCRKSANQSGGESNISEPTAGELGPADVTANEDLMREHGVLRRALLVYREAATRLRQDANSVPTDALEKTAQLFRVFGEDYHEKKLEETYIFPLVKKFRNPAEGYVDVLIEQHVRGREITDYILAVTKGDRLPANAASGLATALESFARMYEYHSAIEDTIVFPAWKASLGESELEELGAKFEQIEAEHFGDNHGFESAVARMQEIEASMGLTDLATFTAPPPPSKP
ncbi:MAG TPA: hemerythrin domain-containing protein [Pyrinomonadaceae bacterium]|nr:hemerythrin domain-containing protein [Pyrinomonadaceae bacterium]